MQVIENIPKLKPRAIDAHKGDFGKVCIIAGSIGFSGAAAIAAKSALRSGSGLVRLAVPQSILPIVTAIEPCYTTIGLAEDSSGKISGKAVDTILKAVEDNDIIAFGPGVGVSGGVKTVLENLLRLEKRVVIDADGLNNLAGLKNWPDINKANLILTPHPGEMGRLWDGLLRKPMPQDRETIAIEFANAAKAVVVFKGHNTIVTDAEKVYVNTTGNPGMATAGAGDVLTGVITSLCGQGLDNFDASVLGVYIHGLAGDLAAKEKGQISMIATDILEYLPAAFKAI
ncbi:MAG: NAD(P)H-hydrate dehydratase [Planctomycetes bacterium]|nr:NAD(P)H-hydrate dehydratase [Planctomycetota bacterium]MBU1517420.1 NAD(P)H-hydrate dehydratase [Planctomycetota bacterium]MBU2457780.1 NAD(P)H-hydrate dehydratase [Planctomycetota bacterium]MBU2596905.1 NAD(P)H-hydrate dehydratase [Planctomycetota bacterium]